MRDRSRRVCTNGGAVLGLVRVPIENATQGAVPRRRFSERVITQLAEPPSCVSGLGLSLAKCVGVVPQPNGRKDTIERTVEP